jgi:hypothetical protein
MLVAGVMKHSILYYNCLLLSEKMKDLLEAASIHQAVISLNLPEQSRKKMQFFFTVPYGRSVYKQTFQYNIQFHPRTFHEGTERG